VKVFVIAGEPSGDRLGAALLAGLRELAPGVVFEGVGGPLMQAEGLESLFDMDELSVMGLAEILPKYRHLKRRIRQTAAAAIAAQPDVVIGIDSPEFCLRVARRVKARSGIRTVHYVAPTVWAWRPGRADRMARVIDQVLALFPFEPPYMEAAGMACDFVGHPIATEPPVTEAEIDAFRARHGLSADRETLLILPGSRRSEVARLAPPFLAAHGQAGLGDMQVLVPTLPHLRDAVAERFGGIGARIIDGAGQGAAQAARERFVAMAAADLALAASGTVSLELAAARTPMVIAYDMAWLSRQIIGRMLRTDTVTLVNLVSDTRVVPEFIGKDCRPAPIAEALRTVRAAPEAQLQALDLTMDRLGRGAAPPGLRAARAVLDLLS
jgi:lipid-A-disaccharide synthase